MSGSFFKRSLSLDLILLLVIPLTLFAMLSGWFILNTVSQESESHQLSVLTVLADEKAHAIDNYLTDQLAVIKELSKNSVVQASLPLLTESFMLGRGSQAYQRHAASVNGFFREFQTRWDYYDLFLIDREGNIVYSLQHEADFATNLRRGPYKQTGLAQVFNHSIDFLQSSNSSFELYHPSAEAASFIATPVVSDAGELLGVIALQLNARQFNRIVSNLDGLGESGEVVVGRQQGGEVTLISPLRFDPQAAFHRVIHVSSDIALPIRRASQGYGGQGHLKDWRGVEVLAAWVYSPRLNAGIVVKMDAAEALMKLALIRDKVFIFLVVIFMLAMVIAMYFSRRISRPFMALRERVQQYVQGHHDVRFDPQHNKQAEVSEMASAFNVMADHIQQTERARESLIADLAENNRLLDHRVEEQTEHIRAIIHYALDGIFTLDAKGTILTINPAMVQMFAYSEAQLLGKNITLLLSDQSRQADGWVNGAGALLDQISEVQGVRCEGEIFSVELSLRKLSILDQTVYMGMVRDISERKKRQQFDVDQLRIMELIADVSIPLEAILEVIVRAVQEYNPALLGSILLMDKEGEHLIHGAAPDLPAAYSEALEGVKIGPSVGSCGTAAFTGEPVIVSDIDHDPLWADYKELALQYGLAACWSQPIKDSHNRVLGTFAMYYKQPRSPGKKDINLLLQAVAIAANAISRKNADQMRINMQSQLEHMQRLESLGVLAGGIAHDFNNILTVILGNAAMAERKALLNPHATQGYLKKIVVSSERAADLCKQMLAYSGKGKFVVIALDLSSMVGEITNLLEISISKSVILKYHLTDQLPAVEADASQLQQVIMNLVINASDAIADKSGVISISTGVMHADRAYLSGTSLDDALPEGRYVYLEVSDTGSGMDKETQEKVFEPFFTTKFTGHGLGMSAVLGIVRGHKGAIKLYSEEGRGTTFKILLPISEQAAEVVLPAAVGEIYHGAGKVLIVDDEETIREMASMMLEDMGFASLTAKDGLDGVNVYRQHQPEITCVLMDMTMPRMDGKTCFTELRRINSEVKVILSSGYNEQEAISCFAGQGLAGFIQKPYTPEALQLKLQEILG
ncbi:MAG: cache domain-containing protein [Mariprofundus sp.]|nr:cache domain-containing protein [Mariprofundus sp.]